MSGIVAVVHLDGAPVDADRLRLMTETLAFRGPDAQRTWHEGSAGLGHTWLRTSPASPAEQQPFTFDGRYRIVADARLDARRELIARLEAAEGGRISDPVPDVELLGRAYRAWGDRCVDHLLGDFAFAVWDQQARRLFVARDHLGIKPLYYAYVGATIVVSNTLACVRRHPRVSSSLNDVAIADFLVFGLKQDPTMTSFADVRRLPAGHRATFSAEGARVDRYWAVPVDEPVRYRRAAEYEEHFRELLDVSVRDRLPDGPVGVFLSGGLDSGTLAAAVCALRGRQGVAPAVRAFTTVWDGINEDEARHAGLTASFLRIPIEYGQFGLEVTALDTFLERDAPEPIGDPALKHARCFQALSTQARVFFYGEGPDNALRFEWREYVRYMLRRRQPGRLALDCATQVIRDRGAGWPAALRRTIRESLGGEDGEKPPFPSWINRDLERRLDLRARWREHELVPTRPQAMRPIANATFESPAWDLLFQMWDCEATVAPLEMRHPFLDLRLLRYLLAVPTMPWCRSKSLLRRAMRGRLPRQVLRRTKSPLPRNPFWEAAARQGGLGPIDPGPEIDAYVDTRSVPILGHNDLNFDTDVRAYMLDHWLKRTRSSFL